MNREHEMRKQFEIHLVETDCLPLSKEEKIAIDIFIDWLIAQPVQPEWTDVLKAEYAYLAPVISARIAISEHVARAAHQSATEQYEGSELQKERELHSETIKQWSEDVARLAEQMKPLSKEAHEVMIGMVEFCIDHGYCMGMDEGKDEKGNWHPDVQELVNLVERQTLATIEQEGK